MIQTEDMEFAPRIITPENTTEDSDVEISLRPQTLHEYIGQDKVKENLAIYIEAAKRRSEPLDHVLLYGPPGLGKTTLSSIIAHELGVNLRVTTGPAIEKPGDLVSLLTSLSDNDVLFIDEIHRLSRAVEEILYPALEDRVIDIIIGKGPSARSIRMDLKPFTLIGATTRAGQLSAPLRDRFGVIQRLELYTKEQLTDIVRRSSMILGIPCTADGAAEIVKVSNKSFLQINDYNKLRTCFAILLSEIQRIKSEGDYIAARNIVEEYGVKVDKKLHKEMRMRYKKLHIAPYKGFINPTLVPLCNGRGDVVDVKVKYCESYSEQMLRYSKEFGLL